MRESWRDRKTSHWIREETKVPNIMEIICKLKWNWLVFWREEQTTVGQSALRSGRAEDIQGTEEDQGRDEGRTWMVSKNCHHVAQKWSSREENHF